MSEQPQPPAKKDFLADARRLNLWFIIIVIVSLVTVGVLISFSRNLRSGNTLPDPPTGGNTLIDTSVFPPLAPLPPLVYPSDNPYHPRKAELGRLLFFDPRMSSDGTVSCSTCHPGHDGSWSSDSPISPGSMGTSHWRNSQTLINVAYYNSVNWDGTKTSLEKQAKGAWTGVMAGNIDPALAEERLAQIPGYVAEFKYVFGIEHPTFQTALMAVATFERTITSKNVPLDAFLAGDPTAITEAQRRGYELFIGQANCIACHNGALISDNTFHNTAVPEYAGFATDPLNQISFRFAQWSHGVTELDYTNTTADLGLYYVTKADSDIGKFRTPSLRDNCYTAPYMHNGVFDTLTEVVAFYNEGGGQHENKDIFMRPLQLTAEQQADLVAFLQSMCGDRFIVETPVLPAYAPWTEPAAATGGN